MLWPDEFGEIFIGMGPFHWSKICIAAIGKFLEPSGITDALAKSGVFGIGVAIKCDDEQGLRPRKIKYGNYCRGNHTAAIQSIPEK